MRQTQFNLFIYLSLPQKDRRRLIAVVGLIYTINAPNFNGTSEFLRPLGELNHHFDFVFFFLPFLPMSELYLIAVWGFWNEFLHK